MSTSYGTDASGNQVLVQILYQPNGNGAIAYEKYHTADGKPHYCINYEEGKISFIEYYDESGTYRERVVNYREDGTTDIEEFESEDVRAFLSSYNADGKLTTKFAFFKSGVQKSYAEYDENENLIRQTEYDESGAITKDLFVTYEEDLVSYESNIFENGICTYAEMKKLGKNGDFIEHRRSKLNAEGMPVRTTVYDSDGNIVDEYDEK